MKKETLALWQERERKALAAYADELEAMDRRDAQYRGKREIRPTTGNDRLRDGQYRTCNHVWNITAENIEAEIDSSIPMPKVTPMRREDERLARMIENMLRNEIDRLPTERVNDLAERIAKIQGAVGLLPEWDNTRRDHLTVGANDLRTVHPKRILPQPGVDTLDDMDWFFYRLPMTKSEIRRRYGVDVSDEEESAPELRDGSTADDMVTLEVAIYRDAETGQIGRYAFVGDTEVEDVKNCQARHLRRCKKCGMTEVDNAVTLDRQTTNGEYPNDSKPCRARRDECSYCHSRSWEDVTEESRKVPLSELMRKGVKKTVIDALAASAYDSEPVQGPEAEISGAADGMPTGVWQSASEAEIEIPYYVPREFPLVMLCNVMKGNSLLGESDCDKIADQQNTVNRLEQKILDKLIKAGKKIVLPSDSHLKIDAEDNDVLYVTELKNMALLRDIEFEGNIEQSLAYLGQVYGESQRVLGITESFLGRQDATADSAKAKQFAAAQTAGRLESKRVLKKWAWSQVFERMFKNMLAYADEKRTLRVPKETGEVDYEEWNSWEFLEIDEAGELWWNDRFLFSCDDASGLAANREAMWKECTSQLQSGAYGAPNDLNALIIYWTNMEELHYPGAGTTKKLLQAQLEAQQQMQIQAQQMAQMQQQGQQRQQMMQQLLQPAANAPGRTGGI